MQRAKIAESRRVIPGRNMSSSEVSKRHYAAHADERRSSSRARYAANPAAGKARAEASRKTPEGMERDRLRSRRYRRENPRVINEAAQRHRARKVSAYVEDVSVLVLLEMSDGSCGVCGEDIAPGNESIDHILSLAGGGEHSYANTQVVHRRCNSVKGAR